MHWKEHDRNTSEQTYTYEFQKEFDKLILSTDNDPYDIVGCHIVITVDYTDTEIEGMLYELFINDINSTGDVHVL
jgi:hypothetical protein